MKLLLLPFIMAAFVLMCASFWIYISDYKANNIQQYMTKSLFANSIILLVVVNILLMIYALSEAQTEHYMFFSSITAIISLAGAKIRTYTDIESILKDITDEEVIDKEFDMPTLKKCSSFNVLWVIYTIISLFLIFYVGYNFINRVSSTIVAFLIYGAVDIMCIMDINVRYKTRLDKILQQGGRESEV